MTIKATLPTFYVVFFSSLLACQEEKSIDTSDVIDAVIDADSDGFTSSEDCDDNNESINPAAGEICDGLDNNCDGHIDEDVTFTIFQDTDQDGYGDANSTIQACELLSGYSSNGTDCNDDDASVYPGHPEICDGLDNDCNEYVDDDDPNLDLTSAQILYADSDQDGFGDDNQAVYRCISSSEFVDNNDDCNDDDATVYPDAREICDNIDNDCDGLIDLEDDSLDNNTSVVFYIDIDGDGYGHSDQSLISCFAPEGYVDNDTDCIDSDPNIHPNAIEVCDGLDNDCDQLIDDIDASVDTSTGDVFYIDADLDGYGDSSVSEYFCDHPGYGYSHNDLDCEDSEDYTYPGAAFQEGSDCLSDFDGDGYAPIIQGGQDCDDNNSAIQPLMTDIVGDGIDQNCDGIDPEPLESDYTTPGEHSFVVPAGVNQISVKMWGAGGAGGTQLVATGGGGAFVSFTMTVSEGETYTIMVGEGGIDDGDGGGASLLFSDYGAANERLWAVAAGGGGGASDGNGGNSWTGGKGGAGGYQQGQSGSSLGVHQNGTTYSHCESATAGTGASQSMAGLGGSFVGTANGCNGADGGYLQAGSVTSSYNGSSITCNTNTSYSFWQSASGQSNGGGGAGGNGYYGGGSGGFVWTYCGGGGGGGSSYTDAGVTDLTHEAGQDQIAGNSADAQGAGQGGERSYNDASESGANGRIVIGW